jgi:xanthine dehydrogenase accessory factor
VLATGESVARTYGSSYGLVDVASLCGGTLTLELAIITESVLGSLTADSAPLASLYLVGANAYAAALVPIARQIGCNVLVVDPRPAFCSTALLKCHDRSRWPEDVVPTATLCQRDAVVVLAHDDRFEATFLPTVLSSEVGYVGALGSRNAHTRRLERLRAAGVSETQIARLAAPIGLDLGADNAAEVAVSIAAEMIAVRHARTGGRLLRGSGPIHSELG